MRFFKICGIILAAAGALEIVTASGAVVVKEPEKSIPYGPIPSVAPVGMSLADGVMLKGGRPYFWIGQGDGPGAYQEGPAGLWLACLQGADGVTLYEGMKVSVAADGDGSVTVAPTTDIGIQSWRREAVRLGLLTDFFLAGRSLPYVCGNDQDVLVLARAQKGGGSIVLAANLNSEPIDAFRLRAPNATAVSVLGPDGMWRTVPFTRDGDWLSISTGLAFYQAKVFKVR